MPNAAGRLIPAIAVFVATVPIAQAEESHPTTHHGGLQLTLGASVSGAYLAGSGSADEFTWGQSAAGVGLSLRAGGIWAPTALDSKDSTFHVWPGLRFGIGADLLAMRFSTDSTQSGWTWPPEEVHDRSWQRMGRLPVYFGAQVAFGRSQVDGSWHGVMMGFNCEPMLVFASPLVSRNEPLFLKSFAVDLTVLNLDPERARPQVGFRFTLTPPMWEQDPTDWTTHDYVSDPWMVSASIGVTWM